MNQPSEQIRPDLSLDIAYDQCLTPKQQIEKFQDFLGVSHCAIETILGKKVLVYNNQEEKTIILHKAISYLGNPHPIFKKRIQLPKQTKSFCEEVISAKLPYNIRLMGVYHYNGGVIFVDFIKDTYLAKKMHNSSAHIYTNDLYQAMRNGVFHKEDQLGNHIYAVRGNKLADYLSGLANGRNDIFGLFEQFNQGFTFGQWLYSINIIKEMHNASWRQWKQGEWPGWFLEYSFNKFTIDNNTQPLMKYVGNTNKGHKKGKFDFDIWFDRDQYYGDLKASDIKKKGAPGNAQGTFVECINLYDKFWYVIYEHDTIKDEDRDFVATKERNQYIRSVLPNYKKDDMSYHKRMKHSVRFLKMSVLELNRINFREILTDFNQGKQYSGKARAKKFTIKKRDMDKYVVYRYTYKRV